jgi:hypothetical protein
MSPYFNSDTGEMTGGDDLYTEPELSAPLTEQDRQQQEDRARREAIGTGKKPGEPSAPGQPAPAPSLSPEAAKMRYGEILAASLSDPWHPLNNENSPDHARAVEEWLAVQERMAGRDAADPEQNPVIGELFNGKIRAPGTDALSPAQRPALPEGHAFDEGALREAESAAHALGSRPSLVMEITDALASVVEQADARGVDWALDDAEAELVRRHGREGAVRVIENAKVAYQTLLALEQPRLVARVRELGEGWGDDPGVLTLFGTVLFEALREGPITPAKEALLLRRAEREMREDAAGHARAAKAAKDAETPDDHVVSQGGRA